MSGIFTTSAALPNGCIVVVVWALKVQVFWTDPSKYICVCDSTPPASYIMSSCPAIYNPTTFLGASSRNPLQGNP